MNQYEITKNRVWQYAVILLVLAAIAGAYFYYQSRGATTVSDNDPTFEAPLTTSIELERGVGSPTFTRADGADRRATATDFEGIIRKVKAGEARFEGARRVENFANSSEALVSWGYSNTSNSGTTITFNGTAGALATSPTVTIPGTTTRYLVGSATLSSNSGPVALQIVVRDSVGALNSANITVTSTPQRFSVGLTSAPTATGALFRITDSAGGSAKSIVVHNWQMEDLTGMSNRNPSEYVSVGVLSAPYHGANVDGVKYFDTENGNTVASNVVTEGEGESLEGHAFGSLSGTSGSYFSTPDNSALDITGDLDIRVKAALTDWTPPAIQTLVGKFTFSGNQRSYVLNVLTSGKPSLTWSELGTSATIGSTSSVAVSAADGTALWIRATLDVDNGSSGNTVRFYTSYDGETWTQLGTDIVAAGTTSIYSGTGIFEVGAYSGGTTSPMAGKIYRAQVFDGIDGTIAADFDPSEWNSGDTWTSRTGEVWTRNGGAQLWKNSLKGYLAEGSRTNTFQQSESLDNAYWSSAGLTITANSAVAPDGTTTAELFTETTSTSTHRVTRGSISASASTSYTLSGYGKEGTRDYHWLGISDGVSSEVSAFFNVNAGTVGATQTGGTGLTNPATSIQSLSNGWYRYTLTVTTSSSFSGSLSAFNGLASGNGTRSYTGSTSETGYFWGLQLETAAFASTYIPTTTASVTRALDALNYSVTENISPSAGTLYAEVSRYSEGLPSGSLASILAADDGSNNNRVYLFTATGASAGRFVVSSGGSSVANIINDAAFGSNMRRFAAKYAVNDFELFVDGSSVGTPDTSGATPVSFSVIRVGNFPPGSSTAQLHGNVKNIKIWQKALDDETLESLTAGEAGATQETTVRTADKTGLIGYWSFDDERGGHATDFSGNDNIGTLENMDTSAAWVPGRVGTALDFDGTNDYVSVGDQNGGKIDNSSQGTMAAWIRYDSISDLGSLFGYGGDDQTFLNFRVKDYSGTKYLSFFHNVGGSNEVRGSTALDADRWYHVAIVSSGTAYTLYVDGLAESLVVHAGSNDGDWFADVVASGADKSLIGRRFNSSAYGYPFDGSIDEFRIYDRALSPDEIAGLVEASAGVKVNHTQNEAASDNLVGLWSFNGPDISGTTAYDRSGEGNNGTMTNGPTPTIGKVGQALSFDGADDRVILATNTGLDPNASNWSVAAWVKTTDSNGVVVCKDNGASSGCDSDRYILEIVSGEAQFEFSPSGSLIATANGTSRVDNGSWHYIVGTRDGTTARLYVDGELEATSSHSGGVSNIDANRALVVGAEDGPTNFLAGTIDEVRLYDTALSAEEVENLYNLGR